MNQTRDAAARSRKQRHRSRVLGAPLIALNEESPPRSVTALSSPTWALVRPTPAIPQFTKRMAMLLHWADASDVRQMTYGTYDI